MPQSAFAARKAAVQAQAQNEPIAISLPKAIPTLETVRIESQQRSGHLDSRRKRRRITDDSPGASQPVLITRKPYDREEPTQSSFDKVKPAAEGIIEHDQNLVVSKTESLALASTSGVAPESNVHQQEPDITWRNSCQDADVKLAAGQLLTVIGEYDLWLSKGSISVLGATIHSSSKLYRIHAPLSHPIPLIKALTNPFGPSSQYAEFHLYSAHSGIRQLRRLNLRFSQLWRGAKEATGSFHIVYHNEISLLPTFQVPNDWQRQAIEILEYESLPIVMICGPKNVGKSSFARYLSNLLLARKYGEHGVAYLDLDPGQPEYTAPADLSLIHVNALNLGPSFAHLVASGAQNNVLCRQHHFGRFSPREDLGYYLDCASDLFNHYKQSLRQIGCPLIINTSGWTHGLGLESILSLTRRILPSHMTFLASPEVDDETKLTLKQSIAKLGTNFAFIPVQSYPPGPRSAADLRSMQFSSYFHLDEPEYGQCRWNSELLLTSESIALSYEGKERAISGVLLLGDHINYDMLEAAIDKTVVALVAIDRSSTLHKILSESTSMSFESIDLDIPDIQDDPGINLDTHDTDSADETLPRPSGYILSHNEKGIPYLTCSNGANSPLDPATSWSMGQALLSSIDTEQKAFHVHTPVSQQAIRSCLGEGKLLILVRGQLGMPEWAYFEEYSLSKAIQEDMTELQSLENREAIDLTSNFDLKSWAQRTEYVEYQDTQGTKSLNKVRRIRRNLGTASNKP